METETNNKYLQASTQAVADENFTEPQRTSRTNRTTNHSLEPHLAVRSQTK